MEEVYNEFEAEDISGTTAVPQPEVPFIGQAVLMAAKALVIARSTKPREVVAKLEDKLHELASHEIADIALEKAEAAVKDKTTEEQEAWITDYLKEPNPAGPILVTCPKCAWRNPPGIECGRCRFACLWAFVLLKLAFRCLRVQVRN